MKLLVMWSISAKPYRFVPPLGASKWAMPGAISR